MIKIVLDAGHGLKTAGKQTPDGIKEWSLNDAVCDLATEKFKKYGVEVLRTDHNEGQIDEPLSARVAEYKAAGVICVISVHHNALKATWSSATGIEVYTDNNPTAEDTKLANLICSKLAAKTGLKNRGVKKAAFTVINQNQITAVLVEGGFMDGTNDYKVITSAKGKQAYADAIVEAVVEMYGLKEVSNTTTNTTGKSYKVVTELNRYSTAADAAAQKNAKVDKLAIGTYYIYNKYPNGVNGMYNISTDKTGCSAGSWINPSENKIEQSTGTVQKLYRVRKSKDDAKSQVGAYSSLNNAISACNTAGERYKVFDWNYKVVYEYKAPTVEPPKPVEPTPTPKVVYDLDYPEKNLIIDKTIKRTDEDCVKAIVKILSNNSSFDINIAKAFFSLAPKYGIDPMMAISQSILETGWFKYVGSAVTPEHHNYCGLGVTSTGITGGIFNTVEDGVTAQLQHLFAYGCKDTLNETIVDPRFKYVTRGIAKYWQQLAGRWAVPGYDGSSAEEAMKNGTTYGQKIRSIYNTLIAVTVDEDEVKKYFNVDKNEETTVEKPVVQPTPNEPQTPVVDDEPVTNTDTKVNNIVDIIIGVVKKLVTMLFNLFNKGDK